MHNSTPPPRKVATLFDRTARALLLLLLLVGLQLPQAVAQPGVGNFVSGPCDITGATTLGDPDYTQEIVGNYTFSGLYHIKGNLLLRDGTFTFMPGTVVYVDGTYTQMSVKGYQIILGAHAIMNAESTVFNGVCETMWRGIEVEPNGKQEITMNDCTIGHALYGIYLPASDASNKYTITNSSFYHNYYHFYDDSRHDEDCLLAENLFYTQIGMMSQPYKLSVPSNAIYLTQEAIHMTPYTLPTTEVLIQQILIDRAVYGVVSNLSGRGNYAIELATLSHIYNTGLWLDALKTLTVGPVTVGLENYGASRQAIPQVASSVHMYGLRVRDASFNTNNNPASLEVEGQNGADTLNFRPQTGVLFEDAAGNGVLRDYRGNDLTYGVGLRSGTIQVIGNQLSNCWRGVRVLPNPNTAYNFKIECNTFDNTQSLTDYRGIWVQPNASLNQQGTLNVPAGNRFVNFTNTSLGQVVNDGTLSLDYYRYVSSTSTQQEDVSIVQGPGGGAVTNGVANPTNACNLRYNLLAGVQGRSSGSVTAYILALQDTIIRQAAGAAALREYTRIVRDYYLTDQQDGAGLEAYVQTLPTANPEAFRTLGLSVFAYYQRLRDASAAATVRRTLLTYASGDAEVTARLRYADVQYHLDVRAPQPGEGLAAADSVALLQVAGSGTAAAEEAAFLLRYYYPDIVITPTALRASSLAVASAATKTKAGSAFQVMYPNPTTDYAHIRYSTPINAQQVEIRLVSLLTGRLAQTTACKPKAKTDVITVDVRALPAGQYVATLVVNGVAAGTQKLTVAK